jgi:biotin carboxyl carrier protein
MADRKYAVDIDDGQLTVELVSEVDARVGDGPTRVRLEAVSGRLARLSMADRHYWVEVVDAGRDRWVHVDGRAFHLSVRPLAGGVAARADHRLSAPMPATVTSVQVGPGDLVERGQTLVVVEAMKMELPIRAPHAGRVTAVHCEPGELVEAHRPLVSVAAEP